MTSTQIMHWVATMGAASIVFLVLYGLYQIGRTTDKEQMPNRSVPPVDLGAAFDKMRASQLRGGKTKRISEMSEHERTLLGLDPSGYRSMTGQEHPYKTPTKELMIPLSHVKALTSSAFRAGSTCFDSSAERHWTYWEWEKENLP